MNCPDDLLLSAWVDGETETGESQAIARHVESCATCRERLASIKRADAAAINLFAAIRPPALPAALFERQRPRRWARTAFLAAAAVLVAALIGGTYLAVRNARGAGATVKPPSQAVSRDKGAVQPDAVPWRASVADTETYEEFVSRITTFRRRPVDDLDDWQITCLIWFYRTAIGVGPNHEV